MTTRVKYPRSFHLLWSPGSTSDDKMLSSVEHFVGQEVVVTAKMDGENLSMYRDGLHARSLDGAHHESQAWVRSLQGRIGHEIPEGWRVCGESMFAKHSIYYTNLPSYFMVFSVWNEKNEALSWDETVEWAELLGLVTVPVLWRGIWDESTIKTLYQPVFDGNDLEGYVVRVTKGFPYAAFAKSLAKFVRRDHVTSDNHWKSQAVVPNKLVKL